ncbi:flippase-like domain-containing protein [Aggregicoccus sp. 17bor-14]|uniref:lysylphosphatidylglycerol synthase transmembrane domain-containing protein n=1 Tax=Myxococcaceae TaxID=31 RepID=UPI00129C84C0|nr:MULTISPECIES: lysylphosphatidylglycerol synthase transmembrane domain-containing protein [Myxococcaceae]MBF5042581.1 flippase-like domain-containing protein [Simulacricoccus sp. 17bor-14]MRI88350.1 flippase-like domain-containing protein [Aggregicoccus sp. 17bor-14]
MGVVGLVLSAALLSTAFFQWHLSGPGPHLVPRFSFQKFVADLPNHLKWLVPFILLQAAIIPLRALQWQRTLRRPVPLKERFHLVGIGAFTHNAVPGKLGDLMRSFLLSRTERIPFVQCLGSVAVCKLLEFASLMLLVALSFAGPFGETMAHYRNALRVAVSVCVGLVALVVLLAHYSGHFSRALARRHRSPRLQHFLSHLYDGLGTARSFRGMAVALLFSVGPVLASALGYGLGLHGLGIQGGLFAGAVVLGAVSLGQSTPGVPAGMGIYYFVTSWAARSLGASAEDAAAYATLTHLGVVIAHVSLGGWCVHKRGIRLRDLRRGGRLARDAASEVAHVDEPSPASA